MAGKALDLTERYWRNVEVRGPDECWPSKLKPNSRGYVVICIRRNGTLTYTKQHRLAWEIANQKPFPEGLVARHTCDNPICVNPAHIVPGTLAQNNKDAVERGRHKEASKTHCPHGHPLSGTNLITTKRGWRACRTCQNKAQARYILRLKASA